MSEQREPRRGGRPMEITARVARQYGVYPQWLHRIGLGWFMGLDEDAKAVMIANHRREAAGHRNDGKRGTAA